MIKRVIVGLFLLLSYNCGAQHLDTLINRLNQSLTKYEAISPFDDPVSIDSLEIPADELRSLLDYAEAEDHRIEPIILQEFYQGQIDSAVNLVFAHPDIRKANLTARIQAEVVQSQDGRFHQIAFAENTGGTYRSRVVYYQYFGDAFKVSGFNRGESAETLNLDADGYHTVDYLGSRDDTNYYFFTGGVRGCNYCFSSSFGILVGTSSSIEEFFEYRIDSRSWGETIQVDFKAEGDSLIHVLYQADDLNYGCNCAASEDYETFENEYETEGASYCYLRFRYHNFRLYLLQQHCLYPDPLAEEIPEKLMWEEVLR